MKMSAKGCLALCLTFVSMFFGIAEGRADSALTFENGKIQFAGIEMPYRVAHVGGTGNPSLVVYLHGGSSKGNDNEKPLNEPATDSISRYLESRHMESIVLVPQCPADKSWGGPMLAVLKSLIDKYAEGCTDSYIFGGSMGGTGTWSMLSAYPGLFTAAMPVAGNPSKCDADHVAQTPVFTVMGTADRIMNVEETSDFVDQLHAHQGIAEFEVEEGWTHEMTCIQSYTTRRLDWVFSHRRNPSSIEKATMGGSERRVVGYYSFDGKALSEPPIKGAYIVRYAGNCGEYSTLKKMK